MRTPEQRETDYGVAKSKVRECKEFKTKINNKILDFNKNGEKFKPYFDTLLKMDDPLSLEEEKKFIKFADEIIEDLIDLKKIETECKDVSDLLHIFETCDKI